MILTRHGNWIMIFSKLKYISIVYLFVLCVSVLVCSKLTIQLSFHFKASICLRYETMSKSSSSKPKETIPDKIKNLLGISKGTTSPVAGAGPLRTSEFFFTSELLKVHVVYQWL